MVEVGRGVWEGVDEGVGDEEKSKSKLRTP